MASDSRLLTEPYKRILELGERELQLVQNQRWDELAALGEEREALIDSLPALAPSTALGSLEQAAVLQQRVSAELTRALAIAREGLKRVDHGRRAAAGYAPPDVGRRKLVDSAG